MSRLLPFCVLAHLLLSIPSLAHADPTGSEAENLESAPSLEVRSDRVAPWQRMALSADLLGPIWDRYEISVHFMPSRFVGLRAIGGYTRGPTPGFSARLALDLRPMGRSFDGVLVAFGGLYQAGDARRYGVFAEGGYSFTWKGVLVSFAAGVAARAGGESLEWSPLARISGGWAF